MKKIIILLIFTVSCKPVMEIPKQFRQNSTVIIDSCNENVITVNQSNGVSTIIVNRDTIKSK